MADEPIAPDNDDLADVSLIDTPIAPAQDAEPSQPAEEAKDDGAETTDKPAEEEATEAKDSEATDQPKDDQTQSEQKPNKADPELAKRAYQDRQRTRQQIAQQIDENYSPKTEEDLIEEGLAPRDAQIEALRQEMAFKEQRAAIAEMNAGMQVDAVNIYNDYPVFDPESPEYDEEFATQVQASYIRDARVQTDQRGIVLNADVPLYDYYQQMYNIYNRGASKGTAKAQTDALDMMSRTENPGNANPGNNTGDDLSDLEERLGDVVIT